MIEPSIVTAVSSLFGGRIYPDTAPADTATPFCTYQNVGGQPSNTLAGKTNKDNTRIQFNIWCKRAATGSGGRQQANTLMRQLEEIVTDTSLGAVSQGGLIGRYDEITNLYGAQQDFSFWW